MGAVLAAITMSVDGYVAGLDAGPAQGLGVGGERLHHWVFGGPWTYDEPGAGEATGEDAAWLAELMGRTGAVIAGRGTYDAGGGWGGTNPWPVPLVVVTHRPEDEPPGGGMTFVSGLDAALARARAAAGDRDVHVMGGAAVIRAMLAEGMVDELTLIVAPLTLGGGTRLFDGFDRSVELEQRGVRQSAYATFLEYAVRR